MFCFLFDFFYSILGCDILNIYIFLCLVNYLFLNWVYWWDIGSQNHTGFKHPTQQNICTLHCVPIAQCKVSFCPHFAHPLAPFVWLSPLCCLCLCFIFLCVYSFLLNPFTFFHPAPQASSLMTAINLFHVSMPLVLFCLSAYFVL